MGRNAACALTSAWLSRGASSEPLRIVPTSGFDMKRIGSARNSRNVTRSIAPSAR
jgi:hypothetical protein